MNNSLKQWLPMLLCCLPAVAVAASVGLGGAALGATLNGPLGLGLIALAVLACPLSMGWMMWRARRHHATAGSAHALADCCVPGQAATDTQAGAPADRLAALREHSAALERELAGLRTERTRS